MYGLNIFFLEVINEILYKSKKAKAKTLVLNINDFLIILYLQEFHTWEGLKEML